MYLLSNFFQGTLHLYGSQPRMYLQVDDDPNVLSPLVCTPRLVRDMCRAWPLMYRRKEACCCVPFSLFPPLVSLPWLCLLFVQPEEFSLVPPFVHVSSCLVFSFLRPLSIAPADSRQRLRCTQLRCRPVRLLLPPPPPPPPIPPPHLAFSSYRPPPS